jgi:hypothetical protein
MTIRNLEGTNMVKLDMARFEKLAQAMADGQPIKRAANAAGYRAHTTFCQRVTTRADLMKRADDLRRRGGESTDLGPVIDRLMEAADTALAGENPDAAKLNVAARLLTAAARLQRLLPGATPERPRGRLEEPDDELSLHEWAAKYGPKS